MRKFQCLLFVLKRSYICYYMICMTVPLIKSSVIFMISTKPFVIEECTLIFLVIFIYFPSCNTSTENQ